MNTEHVTWTTEGFDEAGGTITLNLRQVDALTYRGLTVPVWQIDPRQERYYSGPFIRHSDLPDDLAESFFKWQMYAAIPFRDAGYDHDFKDFMARGGRGFSGDFSEIVTRYR